MTIEAQYFPIADYGNGATTAFVIYWPFRDPADVQVGLLDRLTNAPVATPVLGGGDTYDYTITGAIDPDTGFYYGGGDVVFNTPPTSDMIVVRARSTLNEQDKVLPTNGRFPAKSVEGALDRRTLVSQEGESTLGRAVVIPPFDAPNKVPVTIPATSLRANGGAGSIAIYDGAGDPDLLESTPAQVDAAVQSVALGIHTGTLGAISTTAMLLGLFAASVPMAHGTAFLTAGRTTVGDGGGGTFWYDGTDVSSGDNGGTIRVDAVGRRFKIADFTLVNALTFGALGDGTPDDAALDAYNNWIVGQAALASFQPMRFVTPPGRSGAYRITRAHTWAANIWMADNCYLEPVGANYTALTLNDPGYFVGPQRIYLIGPGNGSAGLHGFYYKNPVTTVDQIRVNAFNGGFGVKLEEIFDSYFASISVENCGDGTAANPAFSITDGGDTSNHFTIARLQVERANGCAILISGNTLSATFNLIHSERATAVAGVPTWALGGGSCTFNSVRLEANNPAAATALLYGNTYTGLRAEGAFGITTFAGPTTVISPTIQGTLGQDGNNLGALIIQGGTIGTLATGNAVVAVGVNIGTVNIGPYTGAPPRFNQVYDGCVIGTFNAYAVNTSAALNNCRVTTMQAFAAVQDCNACTFAGNVVTTGSLNSCDCTYAGNFGYQSGIFRLRGGKIAGNLVYSASVYYFSINGTGVGGVVSPNFGSYPINDNANWGQGEIHMNMIPVSGQPVGWMYNNTGGGTWKSMGLMP